MLTATFHQGPCSFVTLNRFNFLIQLTYPFLGSGIGRGVGYG